MNFSKNAASEITGQTTTQTTQTHPTFLCEKKGAWTIVTLQRRPFHALPEISGRNALTYVNGLEALLPLIRTSPLLSVAVVSDDPKEKPTVAFTSHYGELTSKDLSCGAFEALYGGLHADATDAQNHKNTLANALTSRVAQASKNLAHTLYDIAERNPRLSVHYRGHAATL